MKTTRIIWHIENAGDGCGSDLSHVFGDDEIMKKRYQNMWNSARIPRVLAPEKSILLQELLLMSLDKILFHNNNKTPVEQWECFTSPDIIDRCKEIGRRLEELEGEHFLKWVADVSFIYWPEWVYRGLREIWFKQDVD